MAEYLPLKVVDVVERTNPETGEMRLSAICTTVQPETVTLNLGRVDATRIQKIQENKGNILMIPIRRGEINGRPFASITDGHIFHDSSVKATFELTDTKPGSVQVDIKQPESEKIEPLKNKAFG